jgi:hypothetical protein
MKLVMRNRNWAMQFFQFFLQFLREDMRLRLIPISFDFNNFCVFFLDHGVVTAQPKLHEPVREADLRIISRLRAVRDTDVCILFSIDSDELMLTLPFVASFRYPLFWGTSYLLVDEKQKAIAAWALNKQRENLQPAPLACDLEIGELWPDWVPSITDADDDVEADTTWLPAQFYEQVHASHETPREMFYRRPLWVHMHELNRLLLADNISPETILTFSFLNGCDYQAHTLLFPRISADVLFEAVHVVIDVQERNPLEHLSEYRAIVELVWTKKIEPASPRVRSLAYLLDSPRCVPECPKHATVEASWKQFRLFYQNARSLGGSATDDCVNDFLLTPARRADIVRARNERMRAA